MALSGQKEVLAVFGEVLHVFGEVVEIPKEDLAIHDGLRGLQKIQGVLKKIIKVI